MEQGSLQILIVMVVYMAAVIGIGIFFARRANADTEKLSATALRARVNFLRIMLFLHFRS